MRLAFIGFSDTEGHDPRCGGTHDPLLKITGRGWAHVPSVYGPLFTGVSAAASTVLGTAEVPTRLFYQLAAVAALAAICVVVWRYTRSAGAVAFLALNPAVAIYL